MLRSMAASRRAWNMLCCFRVIFAARKSADNLMTAASWLPAAALCPTYVHRLSWVDQILVTDVFKEA